MLTDANDLPDGSVLDGDVCVVGAGPAGIALALSLGEAGLRVVLVESGGRSVTREQERLAAGESVGHAYFPLERSRARAFGGSSHLWDDNGWFRARPLDPWDLSAPPSPTAGRRSPPRSSSPTTAWPTTGVGSASTTTAPSAGRAPSGPSCPGRSVDRW